MAKQKASMFIGSRNRFLRLLASIFVVSTIFDSVYFPFIKENTNISWLLGVIILVAYVVFYPKKVMHQGRERPWMILFLVVIVLEEIYRYTTVNVSFYSLFRYTMPYIQVYILYLVLVDILKDPRSYIGMIKWIFISFFVISIFNNINFSMITQVKSDRVGISTMNLNQLAFHYAAIVICTFTLFLRKSSLIKKYNKFIIVGTISMLYALIRTGSRSGAIALMVGIMASILINYNKVKMTKYMKMIPILIVILVYIVTSSNILITRIQATIEKGDTSSRQQIWEAGLVMYKMNPVIGYGGGYAHKLGLMLNRSNPIAAHNTYLQILLSFGIIGMIFFMAMIGVILLDAWKRRGTIWGSMFFTVLLMAMVLGMGLHIGYNKLFWVLLALTVDIDVMIAYESRLSSNLNYLKE